MICPMMGSLPPTVRRVSKSHTCSTQICTCTRGKISSCVFFCICVETISSCRFFETQIQNTNTMIQMCEAVSLKHKHKTFVTRVANLGVWIQNTDADLWLQSRELQIWTCGYKTQMRSCDFSHVSCKSGLTNTKHRCELCRLLRLF